MAWTAPITFAAGSILTAAQLNTYLRDNMLLMAPAVGVSVGQWFVADGTNSIAARLPTFSRQAASVATASTTYVTLGASTPAVTITHGSRALVFHACQIQNNTSNAAALCSWAASGAYTAAAGDSRAVIIDGITAANILRLASMDMPSSITPGTSTFTHNYRATTGTGTFQDRIIIGVPF